MSELEIVLGIAWLAMTYLFFKQRSDIQYLRGIIIGVGLGEARVEVDDVSKVVRIIHNTK